jgi:hypothetical protein
VNFSGFLAWWLWRTIYLLKLPRIEKKVRVAMDWTLDLFFSKDFVQYLHNRSSVAVNTPSEDVEGNSSPTMSLTESVAAARTNRRLDPFSSAVQGATQGKLR